MSAMIIPYIVHRLVAIVDIRENGRDIDSVLLVRITKAYDVGTQKVDNS